MPPKSHRYEWPGVLEFVNVIVAGAQPDNRLVEIFAVAVFN